MNNQQMNKMNKLFNRGLLIIAMLVSSTALLYSCASPTGENSEMGTNRVVTSIDQNITIDTAWTKKINLSEEEWNEKLTSDQFSILREKGTERAFSHAYNKNKKEGLYICAGCQNPLFDSKAKFDSGTGWPSFWQPYFSKSTAVVADNSYGMTREEIVCGRCDGHLGHVFNDGPEPTGLRYCMNGGALDFIPQQKTEKVVFAQGCFWCVEEIFEAIKGVTDVVSGYSGGTEKNPTYEMVGSGKTTHAEAVEITYDPSVVSYDDLLKVYFNSGDITQVNGQGNDIGAQYRSIVFYNNAKQKEKILDYINRLEASGNYDKKIAVEVLPFKTFYRAEEYHQDYVGLNPKQGYVRAVSIPRYKKAIKNFPELLNKEKSNN